MTTRHSLKILNQLREYDSFLDSLKVIADMGCGTGEDIAWWATLETRDDPPKPYNYKCFAVDRDPTKLSQIKKHPNIILWEKDFTNARIFSTKVDLMMSHDSLQYSHNPLDTLKNWNHAMNVNGMLIISVPQHSGVEYNNYYSRSYSGCYYHYTPVSLIYMLAVNGFDCKDAYLLKKFNNPWISMAVYKSEVEPMDPATTSWQDLTDTGLLNSSVVESIRKYGYLRQEDIVYPWLDKENYFVDYVSQQTEIPKAASEPVIDGVFNKTVATNNSKLEQAPKAVKETKLLKPVKSLRPPKKKYD
jgi:SAM-dependent methyltransferase